MLDLSHSPLHWADAILISVFSSLFCPVFSLCSLFAGQTALPRSSLQLSVWQRRPESVCEEEFTASYLYVRLTKKTHIVVAKQAYCCSPWIGETFVWFLVLYNKALIHLFQTKMFQPFWLELIPQSPKNYCWRYFFVGFTPTYHFYSSQFPFFDQ